ncbi:MAG: YkgJ family cysteine cluster protein [Vicinamibacterales bacterium]
MALHCNAGTPARYCCRKPGVLVAVPELVRILVYVYEHGSEEAVAALRARAARYVAQVDGRDLHQSSGDAAPCPLLVDDLCSVYDVRPLVCRSYNSTSVEACRRASRSIGAGADLRAAEGRDGWCHGRHGAAAARIGSQ